MDTTTKSLSATELKARLAESTELALLDVREQGVFANEHLLVACCVPLGRLELDVPVLVPRRETPVVLCDGGPAGEEALALRAAARLRSMGYADVAVLTGGVEGWRTQGYELFSGVNVPSKAFGEFVEISCGTPHISARELHRRLERGEDIVIVDSRPLEEFHRMSIPGGIDTPGAELVYRIHDLAPAPGTDVVVNCAGRTRSIVGAQSLINAGLPNRVMALENGTMGWKLAGLDLEHGRSQSAPEPSPRGARQARLAADRVATRFGVRSVDVATAMAWHADPERTVYLLDVRSPEEFRAGHLPGSRHAPGGQLVQATDEYVAVRNARVVLIDDARVRAVMTASWLIQMGWKDVHVMDQPLTAIELETGTAPPPRAALPAVEWLDARELKAALDSGEPMAVVDVSSSLAYRERHIPGAWWAVRSRMAEALNAIGPAGLVVVTANDPALAQLTAADIPGHKPDVHVRVLRDGNRAWFDAGLAGEAGMQRATTATDDVWYKPYEHRDAVAARMQEYLDWEVALVEKVERDGTLTFRFFD